MAKIVTCFARLKYLVCFLISSMILFEKFSRFFLFLTFPFAIKMLKKIALLQIYRIFYRPKSLFIHINTLLKKNVTR